MEYNQLDLLKVAIERASSLNTYWNFLLVVSTAVLGIMASGKEFVTGKALKALLAGAFGIFAATNLTALIKVNAERNDLLKIITDPNFQDIVQHLKLDQLPMVIFHVTIDLIVLLAIIFIRWRNVE